MFKQKKNKTFSYKPRFSKENGGDANLDDQSSNNKEFISKWKRQSEKKLKIGGALPIRTLILALVLLLICMYLLENKYI